jgi:hypothetical protein
MSADTFLLPLAVDWAESRLVKRAIGTNTRKFFKLPKSVQEAKV